MTTSDYLRKIIRTLRDTNFIYAAIFLASLGIGLFGISILATEWSSMQQDVQQMTERQKVLETLQLTNSERIQNQHVRLSALEMYNKEIVDEIRKIAINTQKTIQLLETHLANPPQIGLTKSAPDKIFQEESKEKE